MTAPAVKSDTRLPWTVLGLGAAGAAYYALVWLPGHQPDPLGQTVTALQTHNQLRVFSAELATINEDKADGVVPVLDASQVAVIPVRVDYAVDFARFGPERVKWDAAARTLEVDAPDVQPLTPDVDEARARYFRQGVWITGAQQEAMTRANSARAGAAALAQARAPLYMGLAREAARAAIRQNLAIPLSATGNGNVTVKVRFDGEKEAR